MGIYGIYKMLDTHTHTHTHAPITGQCIIQKLPISVFPRTATDGLWIFFRCPFSEPQAPGPAADLKKKHTSVCPKIILIFFLCVEEINVRKQL